MAMIHAMISSAFEFIRGSLALLFTLVAGFGVMVLQLVTLGLMRRPIASWFLNWYGGIALWIMGTRVHVEGRQHLTAYCPCILTFNHASTMEVALIPALMPPNSTVLAKQEFLHYPIIGQASWALGFVGVKRQKKEEAHKAIEKAARSVTERGISIVIAPEGTRSKDGNLQSFKMGAMHLALATGVPIVSIVAHGAHNIWPRHSWSPTPGDVWIRVLEPVETHDFTRENLREKGAELEERYREALSDLGELHPAGVPIVRTDETGE